MTLQKLTSGSLNVEWCRVLCIEDNKKHIVSSEKLRTEDKDFVPAADLTKDNQVLWEYSGIPYEVKIIDVFGMLVKFEEKATITYMYTNHFHISFLLSYADKKPMPGELKKVKKTVCRRFEEHFFSASVVTHRYG